MFAGCIGLTSAPELPAITLARYCYDRMFYGCIGLATKKFEEGKATLEELYDYAKKSGEPTVASGKQELYETLLNLYAK